MTYPWRLAGTEATLVALLSGGVVLAQASGSEPATPTVWLFLAPSDGDLSKDLRAFAGLFNDRPDVRFRPCLLPTDFDAIATPTPAFAATVGAIRSMPVAGAEAGLRILDDEGLAAAGTFGIESSPAWVYVAPSGRSHVAVGRGANLKGLLSCK